jgi:hypothetical protein
MENKIIGAVVGIDEETGKHFRCILYSKSFDPEFYESKLFSNEQINKIQEGFVNDGYKMEITAFEMSQNDWNDINREYLQDTARNIAEQIEARENEAIEAINNKTKEIEEKVHVKNLKLKKKIIIPLLVVLGIATTIGGVKLVKHLITKNDNKPGVTSDAGVIPTGAIPTVTPTVAPTPTALPVNPIDGKITALQAAYANGDLNYDITNPDEVEKRLTNFLALFDKMKTNTLTTSEKIDFYLMMNGYESINDLNEDEIQDIFARVGHAMATDPGFDWAEAPGQEAIANKRDSAYVNVFLKLINDWKTAVAAKDLNAMASTGKELTITTYVSMVKGDPIITDAGQVRFNNLDPQVQAFISSEVFYALNLSGFFMDGTNANNINDVINPVETIGSIELASYGVTINANRVSEALSKEDEGVIVASRQLMRGIFTEGATIECPNDVKGRINTLANQPVKTLK